MTQLETLSTTTDAENFSLRFERRLDWALPLLDVSKLCELVNLSATWEVIDEVILKDPVRSIDIIAATQCSFKRAYGMGCVYGRLPRRRQEAEAFLREAIDLEPSVALPWNGLAYIWWSGKLDNHAELNHAEIEFALRKAISLDPSYVIAWSNLGLLLTDKHFKGHRYVEAEAAIRHAISLDKSDTAAWQHLGHCLREQEKVAESEVAYRESIRLDDEAADN